MNSSPKSYTKSPRNLLRKVGEKVEQTLHSNVFHGSLSSLTDLPDSVYRRDLTDQEHTISLQNLPHFHMDSPKVQLRKKHAVRANRSPVISTSSDTSWQPNAEDYEVKSGKDRSTSFDTEMKRRCNELLADKKTSLENIRDYDQKASLLRVAMSMNTPDVIVPVIMFLENSLSRSLFHELIKKHPSAIRTYINMARPRMENDYYIAMLKQLGSNEDVAMIRLQQANQTNNIAEKITILDQAATELSSHPWWHSQVVEQKNLLKKQRELQTSSGGASSNLRLENRTTLETFKSVYELDFKRQKQQRTSDKTTVELSKELETSLHMSPELIMCGKLSAIMRCGLQAHYDDFVSQAVHQGFFGKKYTIAPEYLADMVYNWVQYTGESPEKASERTARFLNMIVDPDKRIYFAEKFQNYDVAVDTIANILRDRARLENLRRRIPNTHSAYYRATALLDNTKWKN